MFTGQPCIQICRFHISSWVCKAWIDSRYIFSVSSFSPSRPVTLDLAFLSFFSIFHWARHNYRVVFFSHAVPSRCSWLPFSYSFCSHVVPSRYFWLSSSAFLLLRFYYHIIVTLARILGSTGRFRLRSLGEGAGSNCTGLWHARK